MKRILGVLLIGMLLMTGCTSEEAEAKTPEKTEFAIGETAEIEGLKITVNGSRLIEGDAFLSPDEGTQWIAVDFTFENTGEASQYIAGIFDITMKDDEGREKDQNIWGDVSGSVDGDVMVGEKLSGEKSFVITGDESNLYIYYKPALSGKDPIKFIIK